MAATYQVTPPEQFTFSRPQEWPKWIRRFERFRNATGLATKEETVQVNTLIYTMGDEADDILRTFRLSEEEKKVYTTVLNKFESHFVKRRNVIFERAKFNMRIQGEKYLHHRPVLTSRTLWVHQLARWDDPRPPHGGFTRFLTLRETSARPRSNSGQGCQQSTSERSGQEATDGDLVSSCWEHQQIQTQTCLKSVWETLLLVWTHALPRSIEVPR